MSLVTSDPLCPQVLVLVTFLVARLGRESSGLTFGARDAEWLGQLTTGAWLIITPAIITGILLDTPMAWTLVRQSSIIIKLFSNVKWKILKNGRIK